MQMLTFKQLDKKITPRLFEIVLTVVVGLSFLSTLVAAHTIRPYTSDDVTTQTVVQSWTSGQPRDAIVGEDSYVIKVPFFMAHDVLQPTNSRTKLFVSVLVFNAILFVGIIVFLRTLLTERIRRSRLSLTLAYLPVAWYLALTVLPLAANRVFNFMCPDFRNAEMGAAFLFAALLFKYLAQPLKRISLRAGIGFGLLFLLMAVFFSSDPYFVFVFVVPIVAMLTVLWLGNKLNFWPAVQIAGYIGATVLASFMVSVVVEKMGLVSFKYVPRQFISIDRLWPAMDVTIGSFFKQFSANIWGQKLNSSLLAPLLNTSLLALSLYAVFDTATALKKRLEPRRLLLVFTFVANVLIFTLNAVNDLANDRFLFLAVVCQVILLAVWSAQLKNIRLRGLLVGLYVIGLLVNVGSNARVVFDHYRHHDPSANALNFRIVDVVKKEGVTKGYAPYWSSLINTYYANGDIQFLPATCKNQQLHKLDWVVNKPDFDIKAERSFYLYSTDTLLPHVLDCDITTLGLKPAKVVPIDATYTLYIFDYDIGKNLNHTTL